MNKAVSFCVIAFTTASAFAQSDPVGTQGRDWDRRDFAIANDASVRITGTVGTIDTRNGNTSGVSIKVNGRQVADRSLDAAGSSVSYTLKGNGNYTVYAICRNSNATADSCALTVEKVSPGEVYK